MIKNLSTKGHSKGVIGAALPDAVARRDQLLVLWMTLSVNLLGNMGFTGLNVALPAIGSELGLSASFLSWVVLSQFLAMAAISLPGGQLADIYGRRHICLVSLYLALFGFLLSALASNFTFLVLGRILSGLGLTIVFIVTLTMLTSVYPQQKRGRVLGYAIAMVSIGLSAGPFVCGYLVEFFGWRSIFTLSFLGLLPTLLFCLLLRIKDLPFRSHKFNWQNSFLWAISIVTIFLGLTKLSELYFGPPLLLLGGVLFSIYWRDSARPNPVLDLRLFKENRTFAFASLAAFASFSAPMGTVFVMALYLQYIVGLTSSQAGLVLMVQPALQALFSPVAGYLSDRLDKGRQAAFGLLGLGLATTYLAIKVKTGLSMETFLVLLAVMGTSIAFFMAPNFNIMMSSVPPAQMNQASGTVTATRLCGQVLSMTIATLVFTIIIDKSQTTLADTASFIKATVIALSIFAPLCFIGLGASWALRGQKKTLIYSAKQN